MIWKVGMFLLFEKKVGKITKIFDDGKVKIRAFSKGNTTKGYDWQQNTNVSKLNSLYEANKVRVIEAYAEVLACLFYNFEGCMPIENVRKV